MTTSPSPSSNRLSGLCCALVAAALLSACVVEPPPPRYAAPARPVIVAPAYVPMAPEPVVSVYIDAPLYQPAPIAVSWAPPPMLVEVPPPQPFPQAYWTGGYWAWEGRWVWSAGRWSAPPQPRYVWVQPYYEHRADTVIFVPGFWSPPEVRFVPPPPGITIAIAAVAVGVAIGHPPMGPQGIFVPPPPGSRPGIIVPAPIGTPPAVVVSAPPVVNVGMRVQGNVENNSHNTTINDNRVTNNVTNVTNVTIVAPAGATANGQAFQGTVPARAHLAAALPAQVRATAPVPSSGTAIPSYVAGRAPMALPPPQRVHNDAGGAGAGLPSRPGMPQGQAPQQRPGETAGTQEFNAPPRQPAAVDGAQRGGGRPPAGNAPGAPQGLQPQGQPQVQGQPQAQGQPQVQPQGQPQAQPSGQAQAQPQGYGQPRNTAQPPAVHASGGAGAGAGGDPRQAAREAKAQAKAQAQAEHAKKREKSEEEKAQKDREHGERDR